MSLVKNALFLARKDEGGDFDESKHPRDAKGEFSGTEGAKAAGKPKARTYVQAKQEVIEHLKKTPGWDVHTYGPQGTLKVPYAHNPGGARIEFHSQAVHYGHKDASRRRGSGGMLSLGTDIRSVSPAQFEAAHRDLAPFEFKD